MTKAFSIISTVALALAAPAVKAATYSYIAKGCAAKISADRTFTTTDDWTLTGFAPSKTTETSVCTGGLGTFAAVGDKILIEGEASTKGGTPSIPEQSLFQGFFSRTETYRVVGPDASYDGSSVRMFTRAIAKSVNALTAFAAVTAGGAVVGSSTQATLTVAGRISSDAMSYSNRVAANANAALPDADSDRGSLELELLSNNLITVNQDFDIQMRLQNSVTASASTYPGGASPYSIGTSYLSIAFSGVELPEGYCLVNDAGYSSCETAVSPDATSPVPLPASALFMLSGLALAWLPRKARA